MLIAIHQSIDHSENIYISLISTTVVQNALHINNTTATYLSIDTLLKQQRLCLLNERVNDTGLRQSTYIKPKYVEPGS